MRNFLVLIAAWSLWPFACAVRVGDVVEEDEEVFPRDYNGSHLLSSKAALDSLLEVSALHAEDSDEKKEAEEEEEEKEEVALKAIVANRFAVRGLGLKAFFMKNVLSGVGSFFKGVTKLTKGAIDAVSDAGTDEGLISAIVSLPWAKTADGLTQILEKSSFFGASFMDVFGWAGIISNGMGIVESGKEIADAAKNLFKPGVYGKEKNKQYCIIAIEGAKMAFCGLAIGMTLAGTGGIGAFAGNAMGRTFGFLFDPLKSMCDKPSEEDVDMSTLALPPGISANELSRSAATTSKAQGGKGAGGNDFKLSSYTASEKEEIREILSMDGSITLGALAGARFEGERASRIDKMETLQKFETRNKDGSIDVQMGWRNRKMDDKQKKVVKKICQNFAKCADADENEAAIKMCCSMTINEFGKTDFCGTTIKMDDCACKTDEDWTDHCK